MLGRNVKKGDIFEHKELGFLVVERVVKTIWPDAPWLHLLSANIENFRSLCPSETEQFLEEAKKVKTLKTRLISAEEMKEERRLLMVRS